MSKQETFLTIALRQGSRSKASQVRRQRTADVARLDKLDALAKRLGCGWYLTARIGVGYSTRPALKHFSQDPQFATIREAIDAMPTSE